MQSRKQRSDRGSSLYLETGLLFLPCHTITATIFSLGVNTTLCCRTISDGRPRMVRWMERRSPPHSRSSGRVSHMRSHTYTDVYPERNRYLAPFTAVCRCDPESGCGDNCINRIMSYLCGRDCPCGDDCGNKSLSRRKGAATKVVYVSNNDDRAD